MKLFTFLCFAFFTVNVYAQGVIISENENDNVDPSAILELKSTNKGLLVPRVSSTTNVNNPQPGLVVYQTGGTTGFYLYDGTWKRLTTEDEINNENNTGLALVGTTLSVTQDGNTADLSQLTQKDYALCKTGTDLTFNNGNVPANGELLPFGLLKFNGIRQTPTRGRFILNPNKVYKLQATINGQNNVSIKFWNVTTNEELGQSGLTGSTATAIIETGNQEEEIELRIFYENPQGGILLQESTSYMLIEEL